MRDKIEKAFTDHTFLLTDLPNANMFMVRSTGEEDRVDIANPGGNESIASDAANISKSIGLVISSYLSEKSLMQRLKSGEDITDHFPLSPCLIQIMVREENHNKPPVSGVIYTNSGHVSIQSAPGHGELIVNSKGNFDNYYITPQGKVYAEIRHKHVRLTSEMDKFSGKMEQIEQDNDFAQATSSSLDEETVTYLHNLANFIEQKYGMRMDIEFVYDSVSKTINIVQARPIPEGYKRVIVPSAVNNKFISERNPKNMKANVITANINSASVVTGPEEILICDNIEQALETYLKGVNQIKVVIIKKDAPETSHEAGMFTSKAISVLQMENLVEARQWAENLTDNVLICDPQHKRLYQIPKSEYTEELVQEGIYASTLTSHVTPFNREFKDEAFIQQLFEAMKTTNIVKYDGELLRQHLEKLSIPKFGTDIEQKNILANLLQFVARTRKKEQISTDLFKEIMLTGGELYLLLSSMEKEEYNEQKSQYYLNVFEKFNGLILSTHKKDVLSTSLVKEIKQTKQREKYLQLSVQSDYISVFNYIGSALGFSKRSEEIFQSLTAEQRETFLELITLDKFIMKPENKIKWKNFCLAAYQNNQENILKYLVQEIIKHKIHAGFLNTVFCSEYTKNPHIALRILYTKLNKGKEDRENLSKASKILMQMEIQIGEWSKPEKFSQLHYNLKKNLSELKILLKFGQLQNLGEFLEDPINGPIIINYLNKLVDILDLSIKQVQVNNIYQESQKEHQVENFRELLKDFVSVMECITISNAKNSEKLLEVINKCKGYLNGDESQGYSTGKEQLLISGDFSISNLSLKSDRIPSFKNLADIHTLTHQIILQSLMHLSEKISKELIKNSPEEISKINSIITSYRRPKTINVVGCKIINPPSLSLAYYDYPELITQYHIPLRSHFASIEVKYNVNSNKILLDFKLNGSPVYSRDVGRWEKIKTLAIDLIEKHTVCKLISLEGNSAFVSFIVEPDNFEDIHNIMNIFKVLIAKSFPEENLDVSLYFNKLTKPKRDLVKFDSIINDRGGSNNLEIKSKLKQWYSERLIDIGDIKNDRIFKLAKIATLGINFMGVDNSRLVQKDILRKLLTCDQNVFNLFISNESIWLMEHGLNINSIIKRIENEDRNGFSKEDYTILNNLGLLNDKDNKLSLLDKLIAELEKNKLTSPETSSELRTLILKLTKRLLEEAILKDNQNDLEIILSKSEELVNIDKFFRYKVNDYLTNLAIHGHEQILRRFFDFEANQDFFSKYFYDAVNKGKTLVVKTMLNFGMQNFVDQREERTTYCHHDVNTDEYVPIKCYSGDVAIFNAVENGNIEVVKLLLDAGVNTSKSNSSGYKVLNLSRNKEVTKILRKYAHNPVDYLLETHQNNPTAFMRAIHSLAKNGYDFTSHDSPDRTWDLDSEKITEFLNQEVADGKTTNFRKIIKSANKEIFELALSFKPNITYADSTMIRRFYPDVQINDREVSKENAQLTRHNSVAPNSNSWINLVATKLGYNSKSK